MVSRTKPFQEGGYDADIDLTTKPADAPTDALVDGPADTLAEPTQRLTSSFNIHEQATEDEVFDQETSPYCQAKYEDHLWSLQADRKPPDDHVEVAFVIYLIVMCSQLSRLKRTRFKKFKSSSASPKSVHTQETPHRPELAFNGPVRTCIHTQRPYCFKSWKRRPPKHLDTQFYPATSFLFSLAH